MKFKTTRQANKKYVTPEQKELEAMQDNYRHVQLQVELSVVVAKVLKVVVVTGAAE